MQNRPVKILVAFAFVSNIIAVPFSIIAGNQRIIPFHIIIGIITFAELESQWTNDRGFEWRRRMGSLPPRAQFAALLVLLINIPLLSILVLRSHPAIVVLVLAVTTVVAFQAWERYMRQQGGPPSKA